MTMTTVQLTELFDEIQLATDGEVPEIQRITIGQEAKNSIFQHPPSLFWWPVCWIGETASLDFSIAINPAVRNQIQTACEFKVWLAIGEHDPATCIFHDTLDPNESKAAFGWNPRKIDLSSYAGQFIRLGFQTTAPEGNSAYAWLLWGDPCLNGDLRDDASHSSTSKVKAHPAPKCPHIFLITNDALRRDHLSCYGAKHLQTPNLDSLAKQGFQFTNARSNSDSTLASHLSLFTGKSPEVTGVFSEWGDFPAQLPNLATVLKGQGYQTHLISSEREFTESEQSLIQAFDQVSHCLGNPAQSTSLTIARTLKLLEQTDWSTPQFFWLQLFDPHPPEMPDPEYARKFYPGDPTDLANLHKPERLPLIHAIESSLELSAVLPLMEDGRIAYSLLQRLEDTVRYLTGQIQSGPDLAFHLPSLFPNGYENMSIEETVVWLGEETRRLRSEQISGKLVQFLKEVQRRLQISEDNMLAWTNGVVDSRYPEAMYAANIEQNDAQLGRLFDYLQESGLWEQSCVIHTAPHGECLCEENLTFEHHTPAEDVLQIPFLLKPPAVRSWTSPLLIDTPFQLIDASSLILDICELQGGELLGDEVSFDNLVKGEISSSLQSSKGATISIGMQGGSYVIYRHPYKLLCVLGDGLAWVNGERLSSGIYLFDCSLEKGEMSDLASTLPDVVRDLLDCVDPDELQHTLPRPPLAIPRRNIQIPITEEDKPVSINDTPEGTLVSFIEDISNDRDFGGLPFQKWIRRAEKIMLRLTKERDYALRQIEQLNEAQQHLYQSKRWRASNSLKTSLKGKVQGYPPVDRIFEKINNWKDSKLSEGAVSLWTRGGYVSQIKALRSRESAADRASRFKPENAPNFLVLISQTESNTLLDSCNAYESLNGQSYSYWHCALTTSIRSEPTLQEHTSGLNLIENWQDCDQWTHVITLDARDLLEPHALLKFAEAIRDHQDAEIYYGDEDRLVGEDLWNDPFFKPDWSPELMENLDAVGNAVVISRKVLKENTETCFPWLQEKRIYRLILFLVHSYKLKPFHIRNLLLHVHENEPENWKLRNTIEAKRIARELSEHSESIGEQVWIEPRTAYGTVRMRRIISIRKKVCIIIPTRDRLDLLQKCITSIEQHTSYENYEILIIDNASSEPSTLHYLTHCGHRVKRIEGKFNYAAIHNDAANDIDADWMIFLNNDTEVIDPDWIQAMAEYGQLPDIGAVGIRLLFPDQSIQHQGVVMGFQARASHAFAGSLPNDASARGQMQAARNFSAVTAACMFTRRSVFLEMGGYDTKNFKIAYNDVDYCMRLWTKGYRVVCTPHSSLIHYETSSRPNKDIPEEVAMLQAKYLSDPTWRDPFYHPYLRQDFPNFVPDKIG